MKFNIYRIIFLFFLNSFTVVFSQNFVTQIIKNDSIKLIKQQELREDGLVFYKDEYSLTIFSIENIKHNKAKKYKTIEIAGGRKYCEKCKKQAYYFNIKKIKQLPKNIDEKKITTKELLENLNRYSFGGNYFLIDNIYYKNIGMPIE